MTFPSSSSFILCDCGLPDAGCADYHDLDGLGLLPARVRVGVRHGGGVNLVLLAEGEEVSAVLVDAVDLPLDAVLPRQVVMRRGGVNLVPLLRGTPSGSPTCSTWEFPLQI